MATLTRDQIVELTRLLIYAGEEALRKQADVPETDAAASEHARQVAYAVQTRIDDYLRQKFPFDRVVAEDVSVRRDGSTGPAWTFDPLNGRVDFARRSPRWSVALSCCDVDGTTLYVGVYYPALAYMLAYAAGYDPTLNGNRLPELTSPPDQSRRVVALGPGTDMATAPFQPTSRQENWDIVQHDCTTYALLLLALGEIDGFYGQAEYTWTAQGIGSIVNALGGKAVYHCEGQELFGPFAFTCGKVDFLAEALGLE